MSYYRFVFACFGLLVGCSLVNGFVRENDTVVSILGKQYLSAESCVLGREKEPRVEENSFRHSYRGKWISQVFNEAQQNFDVAPEASENCKRDVSLYLQHLQNQSIWAIRMLESSEWPQVGIFAGMTYHLGNFDECLMISSSGIKGQYCLVEGNYDLVEYLNDDFSEEPVEWPTDDNSAWSAMRMYRNNPVRVNRQNLHWAMCIPSTCSSRDLKFSLDASLQPVFLKYGMNILINVDESQCQIHKQPEYPQGYYNVKMVFYAIITLVLFATVHDVLEQQKDVADRGTRKNTLIILMMLFIIGTLTRVAEVDSPKGLHDSRIDLKQILKSRTKELQNKNNLRLLPFLSVIHRVFLLPGALTRQRSNKVKIKCTMHEFFSHFSAKANYEKLTRFTVQDEDMFIHFVKVASMLFVIYGHRFFFLMSFPAFDVERIEIGYKALNCINMVHLGFVDVFLCYSGFLTYHFNFSKIKRKGAQQILTLVLNRWLRLVPTFSLLALFIAYVLPHLSNGPLWNEVVVESEYCKSNWFVGFMAVSNIIEPQKLCFWVSWFVCVDFQLTVLAGILLFVATRKKKFTVPASIITLVICTLVVFVSVYRNKFSGVLPIYLGSLKHMRTQVEFNRFYVTLFPHVAPFLMGFLSAIFCQKLRERNYKFSMTHIICGSVLSIFIGEYFNIYGSVFYEYGRKYSALENAVYGSMHRIFFVFPFAYIHNMNAVSGIGIVDPVVRPWIFIPLSRLSYSVFLTNTIIQMYHTYSQRSLMATSLSTNKFWWVTTDVLLSYVIGLLLHLVIEAPFGNITKIFIGHLSRMLENCTKANDSSITDMSSKIENPTLNNGKILTENSFPMNGKLMFTENSLPINGNILTENLLPMNGKTLS